jgi:predicted RNA-binding protein YlqC (UPF0109 family)
MKDCLAFIINSILGDSSTKITETSEQGITSLTVLPQPENFGKIIGKKGKIINSIRKLLKVRAAKENSKIFVKVVGYSEEKGSFLADPGTTFVKSSDSTG